VQLKYDGTRAKKKFVFRFGGGDSSFDYWQPMSSRLRVALVLSVENTLITT